MMRAQFGPLLCQVVNDALADGLSLEEVVGTLEIVKAELSLQRLQVAQGQAAKPAGPQIIVPGADGGFGG